MSPPRVRPCDVCGERRPVRVAASRVGAMSFAYCDPCLTSGAEPWGALVGAALGAGVVAARADKAGDREAVLDFAPWFQSVVERSLLRHDKTWDEFVAAVRDAAREHREAET